MTRTLTLVVVMTAMLFGLAAPPAQAGYMQNTCSFQKIDPGKWTDHEERMTVSCFAMKFGVSASMAELIVSHESGWNRFAYNSGSGAAGLFQHLSRYWSTRVHTYAKALNRWDVHDRRWTSPRAQAVVSMAMARASGWGAWCGYASYC